MADANLFYKHSGGASMSEESKTENSQRIDMKEAIRKAKAQLADLMEGETFSHLGLEEVKFEDRNNQWLITLGMNHPWNTEKSSQSSIYGIPSTTTRQLRTLKKVRLDGRTGQLISIED